MDSQIHSLVHVGLTDQTHPNLDLQCGILHAANKNDFKTAYSYFYKAFEGYDSIDSPRAFTGLKYMLLSKIILNTPDDVQNILSGELAMRYAGRVTEALKAIAQSIIKQSLAKFQKAMKDYCAELLEDPIMKTHIESLFNTFMEKKICQFIKPYYQVKVSLVARIISLPIDQVKKKLSQMISDRKLNGYLDQDDGMLFIFKPTRTDVDLRDENCYRAPNETLNTAQNNSTKYMMPGEVVSIDYHNNNSNIPGPSGCGQRSGLSMDGRDRLWPKQTQLPHITSEPNNRSDGRPSVSKASNPPPLVLRSLNSMADQDDVPETDSNELTVDFLACQSLNSIDDGLTMDRRDRPWSRSDSCERNHMKDNRLFGISSDLRNESYYRVTQETRNTTQLQETLMSSSKSNSGGHQTSVVQGRKQHSQNNPTVHLTKLFRLTVIIFHTQDHAQLL